MLCLSAVMRGKTNVGFDFQSILVLVLVLILVFNAFDFNFDYWHFQVVFSGLGFFIYH